MINIRLDRCESLEQTPPLASHHSGGWVEKAKDQILDFARSVALNYDAVAV